MKNKGYILTKLFKKQTIALLLLTVLMVLFFVNFLNRPVAFASEQVASVSCDVCLVNGEEKEIISSDMHVVSSLESSVINFSDVNVKLGAKSTLEFAYSIENVTGEDCFFSLILNKNIIENFKIEYYVDNNLNGDLTQFSYVLGALEKVDIKVVVYVEKVSRDAILNGSLELKFEGIGGSNG